MVFVLIHLLLFVNWLNRPVVDAGHQIGMGRHPSVATDPAGSVHVVYGQDNSIFYTASRDGEIFSESIRVDSLPGLHLGASRGPQIAATAAGQVMITTPGQTQPKVIATGGYPKLTLLSTNNVLCLWEQNNSIWAKIIQ